MFNPSKKNISGIAIKSNFHVKPILEIPTWSEQNEIPFVPLDHLVDYRTGLSCTVGIMTYVN